MVTTYTFLPFLRQGIAKRITAADTLGVSDGEAAARAALKVELTLSGNRLAGGVETQPVIRTVQVAGPGDVLGIERKMILRTEPAGGTTQFEPNFLAYIEFYDEDFPWRYTPARPAAADPHRLRPWMTLIVLKDNEFRMAASGGRTTIAIAPEAAAAVFPDHRETWAWAHVQLARRIDNGANLSRDVEQLLDASPDLGIARLLCPRRLQPNAHYTACLIPAFEAGRLAGLGESTDDVPAQTPSWKSGEPPAATRPLEYPVYFHWQFQTGQGGDFESLARKIRPADLPADKSPVLAMDIHDPGLGLHVPATAAEGILQFEPVLRPFDFVRAPFPQGAAQTAYRQQLAQLLDLQNQSPPPNSENPFLTAAADDPIVLPPLYGAPQAGATSLEDDTLAASWLRPLNLDPRLRAMAGLGVRAVQEHQEELMDLAWRQIGEVEAANQRLREAQGVERAAKSIFRKHFLPATATGKFLEMTAPIHSRVMVDPTEKTTVRASFTGRKQLEAAVNPTLRRVARFFDTNRTAVFSNSTATITSTALDVKQLNLHPVVFPVGKLEEIIVMPTAQDFASKVATLMADGHVHARTAFFTAFEKTTLTALDKPKIKTEIDAVPGVSPIGKGIAKSWVDRLTNLTVNAQTGQRLLRMQTTLFEDPLDLTQGDARWGRVLVVRQIGTQQPDRERVRTTVSDWELYQTGFNDFQQRLGTSFVMLVVPANLFEEKVLARVMPAGAYARKIAATVRLVPGNDPLALTTATPGLNLIMAHPVMDLPAYEYLAEQSKSYILPLLDDMPVNTIALFDLNRSAIEAFLAGLNTEMGRELLWREYPTDQRGSYFRRFWDPADPARAAQPDVEPMHLWTKELGQNHVAGAGTSTMVLVVRGELLRKYPQTIVYAHRAKYTGIGVPRQLAPDQPSNVRFPVFSAFIEPDIVLLGFNLTREEAIGKRQRLGGGISTGGSGNNNPGWFIVFRERPGQLQFGMDEPEEGAVPAPLATWSDLTWQHLTGQPAGSPVPYQLNFTQPPPLLTNPANQPRWGANAAELAAILLQKPVLVARHAEELLTVHEGDLDF